MPYEVALTTTDNPFDPFTQFDDWFAFDCDHGYYSCSRLDRVANFRDDNSEVENEIEKERAIDELVKYDPLNLYMKVTRQIEKTEE